METCHKNLETLIKTVYVDREIYHGSPVAGIEQFDLESEEFKKRTEGTTLGFYIYTTDDKEKAINYAFYRAKENDTPSLYIIKMKEGHNKFADLNDYKTICNLLKLMGQDKEINPDNAQSMKIYEYALGCGLKDYFNVILPKSIDYVESKNIKINNIRHFFDEQNKLWKLSYGSAFNDLIAKFLKKNGYVGAICMEGGEGATRISPWKDRNSFVLYYPQNIEIVAEEHYSNENGNLLVDKHIERQKWCGVE